MSGKMYSNSEYFERTLARFWSKVDRKGPDDCWMWTGTRQVPLKNGMQYGHFGTYDHKTINHRAHRFSWMLANGRIPDEMVIMHKCDMPLCVNPNHLQLATRRENLQDMEDKGRVAKGENQGYSKLTRDQVRAIRACDTPPSELAKVYDVHPTCITSVRTRKSWAWLDTPEDSL